MIILIPTAKHTFGSPPIPRAISKEKDPVDTTGTCLGETDRPSHMIDPFPNEVVIWSNACCNASSFFDKFSSLESLPSDLDFLLPSTRHKMTIISPYYILIHMNQGQIMQGIREQIASIVLPLVPLVEKLHISEDGTNNPFLQPCQRETNKSGMDFQLHIFPSFLRFITNPGVQNIQFSFQIFLFFPIHQKCSSLFTEILCWICQWKGARTNAISFSNQKQIYWHFKAPS